MFNYVDIIAPLRRCNPPVADRHPCEVYVICKLKIKVANVTALKFPEVLVHMGNLVQFRGLGVGAVTEWV